MIQNLQVFKFKYNKIDNNILLYIMSEEQNKNNIDLGNILPSSDTKTDVKEDVSLKGASTDFFTIKQYDYTFCFYFRSFDYISLFDESSHIINGVVF